MTQSIHFGSVAIPESNALIQRQNQKNLKITLLALAALSSYVSMMVLPLHISLPLSAVLMGGTLIFCYAIDHMKTPSEKTCIITRDAPPPPVTVVVSEPAYYYEPPTICGSPIIQRVECQRSPTYAHHAPVGTATITPLVHERKSYLDFNHACHAPVGSRTITHLSQPAMSCVNPSVYASVGPHIAAPVFNNCVASSTAGQNYFTAARAPVGHR